MPTWISRRGAGVGLALTLSACAADGMADKFYDASSAYNRALRWGDFDRAIAYLPPPSADPFIASHMATDVDVVVLDYQIVRMKLDKQTGVAASRVELRWHTADNLVVRDTVVDQLWQFHEGGWVLVDERRVGGTPLEWFADAPEAAAPDDAHPYLPGLSAYRDEHEIGLTDAQKRRRAQERRRAKRAAKREALAGRGSAPVPTGVDDMWLEPSTSRVPPDPAIVPAGAGRFR